MRRRKSGTKAPAGVHLAALAAGAGLVLGGCQSEEPPPTSPSPTVSPSTASPPASATPSPTPTEGEIPAAAREKSEKGAEAFARFYIEQSASGVALHPTTSC